MADIAQHSPAAEEKAQPTSATSVFTTKATPTSVAVPVRRRIPVPPQEPRLTFLGRAREDYAQCRTFIQELTFCKASRRKMLLLLGQSIQEAERLGYDDNLYATYKAISPMIAEWWWADTLRDVINGTLTAVAEGRLARQLSQNAQLVQKNAGLEETLRERDSTIEQLRASNAQHARWYQEAKQLVDKQAQMLQERDKRIDALIDKLSAATSELQEASRSRGDSANEQSDVSDSDRSYDPRFIGRQPSKI